MRFYPLDKLINLHDGYVCRFKIDQVQLLLVQRDGERYLFEASCPHRGHPLEEATFTDAILRCPLHGLRFSLDDGRLLQEGSDACRGLRLFELIYEGNEVGVMLADGPAD
ncbi:Rieske (2Fe-2S) protein [Mangrovimicrobium sediminis]|uniref:Rieske (2Fe-2S) protein n=1 Tax=Mangrovimicrobium sediminis TaxID=2562682 RepID=A0A4Z0M6X3_9GAMM|nr:Rieske (2Fe-2S) protein [Haliea sp. SAOS-164]TGD75271.1 Rieske (2Fe-2S) protein [Haliea sp. SAOS-164]